MKTPKKIKCLKNTTDQGKPLPGIEVGEVYKVVRFDFDGSLSKIELEGGLTYYWWLDEYQPLYGNKWWKDA